MFSIGQLAGMAKVSNRTLRYYEELGLLVPQSRGDNRYRYYDEKQLSRVLTIKMLQESGFSLKEIVAALSPLLDGSGTVAHLGQEMAKNIYKSLELQKHKLEQRQAELDSNLKELSQTMLRLKECFGCQRSHDLQTCAECKGGPNEVVHLGEQLKKLRAAPASTSDQKRESV